MYHFCFIMPQLLFDEDHGHCGTLQEDENSNLSPMHGRILMLNFMNLVMVMKVSGKLVEMSWTRGVEWRLTCACLPQLNLVRQKRRP